MTTETVQEVLRDMRRIAAIQPQELADRIERALAVDDAMVERACRSYHGDRWLRMEYKDSPRRWMRDALTAALIDSAQDGKGE